MKFIFAYLLLLCGFGCSTTYTQQTVAGDFAALGGQQLKLMGYNGFEMYVVDSVKADEQGRFVLAFGEADYGMGSLLAEDGQAFVLILAPNEKLKLKGESLAMPQTIQILSGKQNQDFEQYASEHIRREQARSAWDYLDNIYQQDSLFAVYRKPKQAIRDEMARIIQEDEAFLAGLPANAYVRWFLPLRKLVSSVPTIAQYRTSEIPAAIAAFRNMDYTDPCLYKSGLLRETIEAHFWLIENSGRSLDSVFIEMNTSIDYMVDNLAADEQKLNEITDYLFKLLESRSLFTSAEYLALKVLNEVSCTINADLAAQLESYRAMKKGNTAPDFGFPADVLAPGFQSVSTPQKLSDIKSDYMLIVFGASWCPACPAELYEIAGHYLKWKKHGLEVVFVSLDEDEHTFENFASEFPFISICDYKKWESPVAKAYHIFATPTMFLLDHNRQILLRPNSASHMDAWMDWLVKNKD